MKIYLAGAINGQPDRVAKDWRAEAASFLPNHEMLDPMRRDYRGVEDSSVDAIISGDKCDILGCDIFLAMCAFPSWGTAMEIFYAFDIGKSVFLICPQGRISPWLRGHSHKIFASLEDAASHIKSLGSE